MARVLIVCYSRGGNTRQMAEAVKEAVVGAGSECDLATAEETNVDTWPTYDAIILGSPTYYGHPAAELKQKIDASVKYHGQLSGKVGGAFASCGVMGGGVETAVRAMLDALLVHGMIVQGTASGGHYGPVCVGAPDDAAIKQCRELGRRVAELADKVKS